MRCYHCHQTGHRLHECFVKDAEVKGTGKGKCGKGFTNKGKVDLQDQRQDGTELQGHGQGLG